MTIHLEGYYMMKWSFQLYLFIKVPIYIIYVMFVFQGKSSSVKGPVKLIQRVKRAHSFSQPASNLFHFMILSLPM